MSKITAEELNLQLILHPHPIDILIELSKQIKLQPCSGSLWCGIHLIDRIDYFNELYHHSIQSQELGIWYESCDIVGHQLNNIIGALYCVTKSTLNSPVVLELCRVVVECTEFDG
jgi:hypothetical protein